MKKLILMSLATMILLACNSNQVKDQQEQNKHNERTISTKQVEPTSEMSNPAIMLGSDLGSIIRKAFQIGDYHSMVRFTADSLVENLGKDELIECYKQLDMGKEIELKSVTSENDLLIMNYEATYRATKEMVRLPVVIENDTAKIYPQAPCSGSIYSASEE